MRIVGALLFLLVVVASSAQQSECPSHVCGDWSGILASRLRIIFHAQMYNRGCKWTIDSPDQRAFGLTVDRAIVVGDSIFLSLTRPRAEFAGKLFDNGSSINGVWIQGGALLPLELSKGNQFRKPQTPQPPLVYNSQEVIFKNAAMTAQFAATITSPRDGKRHPGVILISGTGSQDRDGSIGLHKPFAVIADHLTKHGYVVMRVDDRGVGGTVANDVDLTIEERSLDVLSAIVELGKQMEDRLTKIGLIGHSEGGIIAVKAAAARSDVAFIVLLAAPAVTTRVLLLEQNRSLLKGGQIPEEAISSYLALLNEAFDLVTRTDNSREVTLALQKTFTKWRYSTDPQLVRVTTGVADSASEAKFVNTMVAQCNNRWFRSTINHDPIPELHLVRCPVLALNGDRDIQVAPSNLNRIGENLKSNGLSETKVLRGLNHLFQNCRVCDVAEYYSLDETFSQTALDQITGWLQKIGN